MPESENMKNPRILICFLLPILFFLSSFVSLVLSSQTNLQNHCLDEQRSALLQLHHDLYYAPNFTFSSGAKLWDLNTDCCSWKGITCDALGHVIGLDLSYKNLSGTFHSIFSLHHLQRLNLAGNNFNTTLFQYEFDRLSNLTHLNLSDSCFYGQIPVEISYSTRLVSLDLSNQDSCYLRYQLILDPYYHDPLPLELQQPLKLENPNFKTLIENLRLLRELYLDSVNISTHSTRWCETTSIVLPNLLVLSLLNCGLTGPFCSTLSKLPFLSKLFLGGNPISYLPPNFLEISSHLVSLNLADCNLSGHFPTEILLLPKIQSIDISNNDHLMGQLPKFPLNNALRVLQLCSTNFSGKLPETIGDLKLLTTLDLSNCNFYGQIPSSIANLTNLVQLDLGFNNFSGLIPAFHGSGVPKLTHLYLERNRLSSSIHSSLFTLPSLQTLVLSENQLDGEINEFTDASSSSVKYLYLDHNNLRGSIPKSITQLPKLELLYIGYNNFDSLKLDMFFQLKNLRYISLSNMSFSIGSHNKSLPAPQSEKLNLLSCNLIEFPKAIKTQDKLAFQVLSNNQIHGFVPNWLWKKTRFSYGDVKSSFPMLKLLFLQSCNKTIFPDDLCKNKISGAVPNWVWKKHLQQLDRSNNSLSSLDQVPLNQSLTFSQGSFSRSICNLSQPEKFSVSYNKSSGPIPSRLSNICSLRYLDLQENKLEGKMPRSLTNCTNLVFLNLGNNNLHDTFPSWLGKLPALEVLILRGNRFHGPIKDVKYNFPVLDVLDIASNDFSGRLPTEFLQAPQLRSLKMNGNKFEGKLPRTLASYRKLEVLDVGHNMIHDTFPSWLVKLPHLLVLVLRANRFYGTINISEENALHILDLASNNFSGELSVGFFQSLKAMSMITNGNKTTPDYIGDAYYQDSVTIVTKGLEFVYQKILTIFVCLDLSNNSFNGTIPEEIQNPRSLKVLNFSHNSFLGPIPLALGNLNDLESLDLSHNKLSGNIPLHLTSLTFLAVLNLSYNQLEGSIPQSYQFGTFSNDSYIGNLGLCGLPLTRTCNEVGLAMPSPKNDVQEDADSLVDGLSDWKIVLMGYGCGLVIGFCAGYTVLNELGDKWFHSFTWSRIPKWRRSR